MQSCRGWYNYFKLKPLSYYDSAVKIICYAQIISLSIDFMLWWNYSETIWLISLVIGLLFAVFGLFAVSQKILALALCFLTYNIGRFGFYLGYDIYLFARPYVFTKMYNVYLIFFPMVFTILSGIYVFFCYMYYKKLDESTVNAYNLVSSSDV